MAFDTALVIMARLPECGKVKTRLAKYLGQEQTLQLYQAFLADLAARFTGQPYDLLWAYTPPEADFATYLASLMPMSGQASKCFPQQGAELGSRLHHVFVSQVQQYRHVVVIGSDIPHMSHAVIERARQALDTVDVVLGPSDDGGYYLIAMREPHDLFSGIPMSTDAVLRLTIERAYQQNLTIHLLEKIFDIDEQPDLLRLAHLLRRDSSLAPATASCLAHLPTKETSL